MFMVVEMLSWFRHSKSYWLQLRSSSSLCLGWWPSS